MSVSVNALAPRRSVSPWATFGLASVAQFMVILDASIMNVALPTIRNSLHFSLTDLQWVINIYVLVFAGFLLLGGRAGDLFGRRRLFIIGIILFSIASLVGGFSQTSTWLVVCRGVQGLGAAIVSPVALAIVTSVFEEGPARNRAIGIYGSLAGVGGAAGVLLGGILTSGLGWQWCLYVNVPVGLAAAALAPRFIPADVLPAVRKGFDLLGALFVTAGLVALVYGIVKAPDNGWTSGRTIGFFVAAAVLLGAFLWNEMRSASPLVRLGIFRLRSLSVTNMNAMLAGAGMFAMFYFLSLYLQIVLHFSALKTGFAYLPLACSIIVAAGIASQLVTRFGFKLILVAGGVVAALGLALLTRVEVGWSYFPGVFIPMVIVAFGLGLTFVPLNIAAVSGVDASEIGLASGLLNTSLQVGGALGLAVLSTIATTRSNNLMAAAHGARFEFPYALTGGFHYAFAAGAILLAAGAVIAFVLMPSIVQRGATAQEERDRELVTSS